MCYNFWRLRGVVIMPMSNYQIFERIKRLVGDAATSAQLNIGVAIQRLQTSKGPAPQSDTTSLRSTTDYYPVIARAVSALPNNTRDARQALYDRAWVALAAHLHEQDPPASEPQVASEQLAFQGAICKVEVEMAIYKVEGNAQKKEQPTTREQPQETQRRPFSSFLSLFQVFKR